MHIYGFDDEWYAGAMGQLRESFGNDTSADADAIAAAIAFAGCVIAQSIDHAVTGERGKGQEPAFLEYLYDIAWGLRALGEKAERENEANG